jgi:hypothetical protein
MDAEKLDLETRCFNCNAFAYGDRFDGEYGPSGYLCLGCIRQLNKALVEESKRRFFDEQEFIHRKD